MSYILDALRKAERERRGGGPPTLETVHAAPRHVQRRRWSWLVAGLAVANLGALVVLGRGSKLVGKGQGPDLTAAIDQSETRLEKQIRRFHARLKSHRARDRIGPGKAATREEEEATYEQVVREMLEEGEE